MTMYSVKEDQDSNGSFDIYNDGNWIAEAFWLTDEDSDESMRAIGLIPIEEKYGTGIEGYREIGETLYTAK